MRQKAFTLTELLVVVVIIGVLAAVVLPMFTKAVEMHKISEAQEMMNAVRNEQEARCTLGKNYIALDKLQVFAQGKNFTSCAFYAFGRILRLLFACLFF